MSEQFVQLTSCLFSKYKTLHDINLNVNKGIGLEIPATETLQHKKASKILKLRELLKGKEEKAVKRWSKAV